MANVKTILDTRRTKSNGTYNIIFKAAKRKSIYIDTTGTINPCPFCHRSYGKVLEDDLNSRLEQLVNQGCIEYVKTLLN